jgi:tetratricopeptide (TPR) repeat protein
MNRRAPAPVLLFLLLLTVMFSLGVSLQPRALTWGRPGSDSLLKVVLGDGRRLFANHFFVKADVYFHSGYYPTIFDRNQAPKDTRHLTESEAEPPGHDHAHETPEEHAAHAEPPSSDSHQERADHADHQHAEDAHEREMAFFKEPKDWVERFGRRFLITEHTHLEAGAEREILPWLRLSAELDPERIETYTVAAFWLRNRLQKVKEAETFLREGLKANPNSHEILFELGRLYEENYHDAARARNVWELALKKWTTQQLTNKEPDLFQLEQIAVHLARLEENQGNFQRAIDLLRIGMKATPRPDLLQKQIDELQKRLATPHAAATL